MSRFLSIIAAAGISGPALHAQQDTVAILQPVVVTITRGSGRSVLASPFALSVVRPDSARPGQRHTAVDETLALVPGLSATNRNNPSQDPRLSIRGFGARSAFGVRGVRVLRDGMPLTLPDGQTPLDYLSLESVGTVEVMRGSASALYGNSSGGVVDLRTEAPSKSRLSLEGRQWLGDRRFLRSTVAASGTSGKSGYIGDVSLTSGDGSRNHSRHRATSGFARAEYDGGNTGLSLTVLALRSPLAENPGALTLEEMRADPERADPSSVRRDARKSVSQVQVGASVARRGGGTELTFSAFGGARSLDNPLTFAIVEIGRHSFGASGNARTSSRFFGFRHGLLAGIDLQFQNDLRRNYVTCADTIPLAFPTPGCPRVDDERGVVTLDQRELVSSAGAYLSDEVRISERLYATAGIRADNVRFEVRDRLKAADNPDDSGKRSLAAVSPIAGFVARIDPMNSVYANFSAAFETPTATELGNQPDGSAGINRSLEPQRSRTVEVGAKGYAGDVFRYDAAVFATSVRDELVPFEIAGSNGRRFFRNAGRTRRRGAEVGAEVTTGVLSLSAAYNYAAFNFVKFGEGTSDYSGNEIPGIPRHRMQAAVRLARGGGFMVAETELSGPTFVDDANTARAQGYVVSHLRLGMSRLAAMTRTAVVAGVRNMFDRTYAASLSVNAARGRYFEPASSRNVFVGVTVATGGERQPVRKPGKCARSANPCF